MAEFLLRKYINYIYSIEGMRGRWAAAAVGAAIFGMRKDGSSSKKDVAAEPESLMPLADEPLSQADTDSKPVPDGLAAGYDNDQLSLARQLQEEFGKKSKKDKKNKRQSLPSTPPILPSRSRATDDSTDGMCKNLSLVHSFNSRTWY